LADAGVELHALLGQLRQPLALVDALQLPGGRRLVPRLAPVGGGKGIAFLRGRLGEEVLRPVRRAGCCDLLRARMQRGEALPVAVEVVDPLPKGVP